MRKPRLSAQAGPLAHSLTDDTSEIMATSENDLTIDEILSTDWYILPFDAEDKARFKPVHDETDWARVKLMVGCYAPRALDASTPTDVWDHVSAYQGGARLATILRRSRRYTNFQDLRASGRLLTAEEYETRRRRAIALHKRMASKTVRGTTDHHEAASQVVGFRVESLIQLTEAEHERVQSAVLSARPNAGEREEPHGDSLLAPDLVQTETGARMELY